MKKYIITEKPNNVIIAMGEELGTQENGNWWLIKENTAFPNTFCAAYDAGGELAEGAKIGEGVEIPEGVEVFKYCYDGKDFTENPDYEEPSEEETNEKE